MKYLKKLILIWLNLKKKESNLYYVVCYLTLQNCWIHTHGCGKYWDFVFKCKELVVKMKAIIVVFFKSVCIIFVNLKHIVPNMQFC